MIFLIITQPDSTKEQAQIDHGISPTNQNRLELLLSEFDTLATSNIGATPLTKHQIVTQEALQIRLHHINIQRHMSKKFKKNGITSKIMVLSNPQHHLGQRQCLLYRERKKWHAVPGGRLPSLTPSLKWRYGWRKWDEHRSSAH